jgi:phosphate transport system substrate-binding protein
VMIRFSRSGASALSMTALAIAASAILAACSGHGGSASSVLPTTGTQSKTTHDVTATNMYGGGSSLAALLYRQWEDYYGVAMPPDTQGQGNGLPVNANYQYYYASIGSGGGRAAFLSQTPATATPVVPPVYCPNNINTCYPYPLWHYSGSDATFSSTEISCYQVGCPPTYPNAVQPVRGQYMQIPSFATAITEFYNPIGQTVGSHGLNLSRNSYCGIWEGAITNWGDPGITSDNGGHQVSTQPIVRVVRSDSSGTTFLQTNHLNTVCQGLSNPAYDWTAGVGGTVTWPAGSPVVPGNGSGGVVSAVQANSGAIGYVGPSYVAPIVSGGLPTANLQNQFYFNLNKLTFLGPTIQHTLNGFKGVNPPSNPDPFDLAVLVPDPLNQNAYPIVGFTWLEIYQCYNAQAEATGMKDLVKWYAAAGPTGSTPADAALFAQGEAPLNSTWKKAVRGIAGNIVKGPITNTCTI